MKNTCRSIRSLSFITLISLLTAFAFPSVVSAATTTLKAIINPGTLDLVAPSIATISAVTLGGAEQVAQGSLGDITITDNRGSGAGWSVTLATSDFTANTTQTIPAANLSVEPGSVTVLTGKSDGVTAGAVKSPTAAGDPLVIMNAGESKGMGRYKISPVIKLTIPSETLAGEYTATITVTVI